MNKEHLEAEIVRLQSKKLKSVELSRAIQQLNTPTGDTPEIKLASFGKLAPRLEKRIHGKFNWRQQVDPNDLVGKSRLILKNSPLVKGIQTSHQTRLDNINSIILENQDQIRKIEIEEDRIRKAQEQLAEIEELRNLAKTQLAIGDIDQEMFNAIIDDLIQAESALETLPAIPTDTSSDRVEIQETVNETILDNNNDTSKSQVPTPISENLNQEGEVTEIIPDPVNTTKEVNNPSYIQSLLDGDPKNINRSRLLEYGAFSAYLGHIIKGKHLPKDSQIKDFPAEIGAQIEEINDLFDFTLDKPTPEQIKDIRMKVMHEVQTLFSPLKDATTKEEWDQIEYEIAEVIAAEPIEPIRCLYEYFFVVVKNPIIYDQLNKIIREGIKYRNGTQIDPLEQEGNMFRVYTSADQNEGLTKAISINPPAETPQINDFEEEGQEIESVIEDIAIGNNEPDTRMTVLPEALQLYFQNRQEDTSNSDTALMIVSLFEATKYGETLDAVTLMTLCGFKFNSRESKVIANQGVQKKLRIISQMLPEYGYKLMTPRETNKKGYRIIKVQDPKKKVTETVKTRSTKKPITSKPPETTLDSPEKLFKEQLQEMLKIIISIPDLGGDEITSIFQKDIRYKELTAADTEAKIISDMKDYISRLDDYSGLKFHERLYKKQLLALMSEHQIDDFAHLERVIDQTFGFFPAYSLETDTESDQGTSLDIVESERILHKSDPNIEDNLRKITQLIVDQLNTNNINAYSWITLDACATFLGIPKKTLRHFNDNGYISTDKTLADKKHPVYQLETIVLLKYITTKGRGIHPKQLLPLTKIIKPIIEEITNGNGI